MDDKNDDQPQLVCPSCREPLNGADETALRCGEDHYFTGAGLALTSNFAAVQALWRAIQALETDAATLRYMANQSGDADGFAAVRRRAEAAEAQEAADVLRIHARRAQERLDALPTSPSNVEDPGGESVSGTG